MTKPRWSTPPLASRFTTAVTGVTFVSGYPGTIRALARSVRLAADQDDEVLIVDLVRVPDNPHDANAIEVHVRELSQQIGHVPAELAARLAPELDRGTEWAAWVEKVRLEEEHLDRPGIDIGLERN